MSQMGDVLNLKGAGLSTGGWYVALWGSALLLACGVAGCAHGGMGCWDSKSLFYFSSSSSASLCFLTTASSLFYVSIPSSAGSSI
jgi:hypothetical protein